MNEMSSKEALSREKILRSLETASKQTYFLVGIQDTASHPSMLVRGAVGIVDWELHGQVSSLILKGERNNFLIPHPTLPIQFLFVFYQSKQSAKTIFETLQKMKIERISCIESTFEKDIWSELKQNLKKGQIELESMEQ